MGTLSETLKLQRTCSFSVPSNRPPGPLGKVGGVCGARPFQGLPEPWRVEKPPVGRGQRRGPKGPLLMSLLCLIRIKSRSLRRLYMIDQNRDEMMNQAPGAINFTMFLTLFGERLQGTDPEDVIRNAFGCFDENLVGALNEDYLRELLTTLGDRFTQDEVDDLYKEAPIKNG